MTIIDTKSLLGIFATPGLTFGLSFPIFGENIRGDTNLGTRETLSDVGATIAEIFKLEQPRGGESLLNKVV